MKLVLSPIDLSVLRFFRLPTSIEKKSAVGVSAAWKAMSSTLNSKAYRVQGAGCMA